MTTLYAVDSSGRYLGAFVGVPAPSGAVSVPVPPVDARQTWTGSIWSPVPVPVPDVITRRQCALELLARGIVVPAEALAMTQTGAPPAVVQTVFDAMPPLERVESMIHFAADTYRRENSLLVAVMTATGATATDIDNFFRAAAAR